MRLLRTGFLLLLATQTSLVTAEPTLCAKNDEVFFSCVLDSSGKIVSLCGDKRIRTPDRDADEMYLVYRFGRVGAIELEYPRSSEGSIEKFKYFHQASKADMGDFDLNEVSFSISEYNYLLFYNALPRNAGEATNPIKAGVRVSRKNRKATELLCGDRLIERLLWLQNVVPAEDNGK